MNVIRLRAILRKHGVVGVLYVALVLSLHHFWIKHRVPFLASLAAVIATISIFLWPQPALRKTFPPIPSSRIVPFTPPAPHIQEREQEVDEKQEKVSEPNESWPVVLKMSIETYKEKHPGNQYMSRKCAWHYGDCLIQRVHYRMRHLPAAKRRYLRRLEKTLDDWGQAEANWSFEPKRFDSSCGFVFSEKHLACGRAMNGIVWAYLHPKQHAKKSNALQQKVHKYVASLEAAEGPITHFYRHAHEKCDHQAELDEAIETLRKATLHLQRETKQLHGMAANYVAAYIPDAFGERP